MTEYNPEVEELDLEDVDLFEGDPDSDVSPTHRGEGDLQDDEFDPDLPDDIEEGEALGDGLEEKEGPDA